MPEITHDNKRIAKNTVMLYIRMAFMMLISLYTSRVVLEILGVVDFGIYNVISGVVILFSFINNALVLATQRYLNVELGRGNEDSVRKVFSASLVIHVFFALILIIVGETIGLWFVMHFLSIPGDRWVAALWVYQFAIFTAAINLIRAPYNAVIIACERMSFFAYISVIEAILKLAIVGILVFIAFDKLASYALLLMVVTILITGVYIIYCKRHFAIIRFKLVKERNIYLGLISFSGWNIFGSVANVGTSQGISIILNMFFGVIVNAAMGIANQVNVAIYNFVSNFQVAFTPQLMKSYAAGDKPYFMNLIIRSSKYSFFLLFIIALPVYICINELLSIWLTDVPEYANVFCRWMLIYSLLDAIQCPLWTSVQATGKIKNYQIVMSVIILANLPLCWIAMKLGCSPSTALIIRVVINALSYIVRVVWLKSIFNFPAKKYFTTVILPCGVIMVIGYFVTNPLAAIFTGWIKIISITLLSLVINAVLIFFIGMDNPERQKTLNFVKKRI